MHMPFGRFVRLNFALLAFAAPACAEFSIPGFELVHTVPVATDLKPLDVRDPTTVWCEMIDGAQKTIDFEQFYVTSVPGTAIDRVITRLEAAAQRGVRIRFLMEKKGMRMSDAETLARLQRIPHIQFRQLAFADVSGDGIIHAKFFTVDGKSAYVGSQNFDWRAMEHIDETGLKIDQASMVAQLQAIFERDWAAQDLIAHGKPVPKTPAAKPVDVLKQAASLTASPAAFNPKGVAHSETALVRLLGDAKKVVRVTVMDYAPLGQRKDYYDVVDRALRAAAQRGVKIELMVANWNLTREKLPYLKSLAVLPNIQLRIVTLPQAPTGFIPFARVVHSKTMTIDDRIAWIGTSNWEGGYFDNSRNIEIVLQSGAMAEKLNALHAQLWQSSYARPLDVGADYPAPYPGTP